MVTSPQHAGTPVAGTDSTPATGPTATSSTITFSGTNKMLVLIVAAARTTGGAAANVTAATMSGESFTVGGTDGYLPGTAGWQDGTWLYLITDSTFSNDAITLTFANGYDKFSWCVAQYDSVEELTALTINAQNSNIVAGTQDGTEQSLTTSLPNTKILRLEATALNAGLDPGTGVTERKTSNLNGATSQIFDGEGTTAGVYDSNVETIVSSAHITFMVALNEIQLGTDLSPVWHYDLDANEYDLHEPKGTAAASANTEYIADGAGSGAHAKPAAADVTTADAGDYFSGVDLEASLQLLGPTIEEVVPVYGEIYTHANATATTISVMHQDYLVEEIATNGLESDMTQGAGFVEAEIAGVYQLDASVSFTGTSGDTIEISFGKNIGSGYVQIDSTTIQRKLGSADVGACSIHGLVSLAVGDKVGILVRNTTTTNDVTFTYANFIAQEQ